MNNDATLQSLSLLDDPERYTVIRGVPIFRAHRRVTKDESGQEREIVVNDGDLPVIARNMAALEQQYGVAARVTDGHINPAEEAPESSQPGLVGFARHPRAAAFGPSRTPAVLVDLYIRNEQLATFRNRPYRSAEYYPPTKEIRGVALLLRDPGLDLGIVTYDGDKMPYLYAMENSTMADSTRPDDQKPAEDDFSPDEVQQYERMCRYLAKKGFIKYETGPSVPAAGNTAVPGDSKKKPDGQQPVLNSLNADPVLYAKLELAEKRIADLLEEREREKCVAMINQLKAERYMLDEEVEIKNLLARTGKEREAHLVYIRKTHAQLPGGGNRIEVYSGPIDGGANRPTTEEAMKKAVSVATKRGLSYDDALDLVKSGKA